MTWSWIMSRAATSNCRLLLIPFHSDQQYTGLTVFLVDHKTSWQQLEEGGMWGCLGSGIIVLRHNRGEWVALSTFPVSHKTFTLPAPLTLVSVSVY